MEAAPIDLAAALPGAPFAVHHGGLGFATWCLAYGVPQVIVAADLEKALIADAVVAGGAGTAVAPAASARVIAGAICAARALTPPPFTPAGDAVPAPAKTIAAVAAACRSLTA